MSKCLIRDSMNAIAVVMSSLMLPTQGYSATHADTSISVQIAVRKDRAMSMHSALKADARFAGCAEILGGQQARKGHGYFVDHFVPAPDDDREPYIVLYYFCEPVNDAHYVMFSEHSVSFAKLNPGYMLRLLMDTNKHPPENCPTQYCALDGAFHHTHPSRPCKYQC